MPASTATPARPENRIPPDSPFVPGNSPAYARWRETKLAGYPDRPGALIVEVADPRRLTDAEHARLLAICRKTNMVIYASQRPGDPADKAIPRELGARFGLAHLDSNMLADEDAISSIEVMPAKSGRGYIPYSSRRLLWHTDGYYNPPLQHVRAFVLHCVRPAVEGGGNALLDPEIAYLLLRDDNPRHIQALMAPDAMTIPANDEAGGIRAAQTGPVFSVDPATGSLHMRYTARTRSIVWKDDAPTRAAVQAIEALLNGDSPHVFRHRLVAGQGLLCNNVLHNRTAFTDAVDRGATRLIYRVRYYDRIAGTGLREVSSL
jgi:alpha-ketoglutarate-dependent taurine dioxygenase